MTGHRLEPVSRPLRAMGSRRDLLKAMATALPALALTRPPAAAIGPTQVVRSGTLAAAAGKPSSGSVEVGGRALHYQISGTGAPTVVLESDVGTPLLLGQLVLPLVAGFTRVVRYDIASLGQSDPAPAPRTIADGVADLHTLLGCAGLPGPYVLVGHGYGGQVVRRFAGAYPGIAGLVLVDVFHEGYLAAGRDRLRAASAPPAVPTVVIARGCPDTPSSAAAEQLWRESQREVARLAPGAAFVVARQSGHMVPADQPELVAAQIRRVVERVRRSCPSFTARSA